MKHKGAVLAVALVLLLMGSFPLFGQQGFSLKNDIVVESGDVQENIFSIGGSIHIKGKVEKTVIAVGGTIIVEGEVGEAVMGIGTEIILKSSGRIEGDLVAFGGTLTKAPGAVIEGDTVYFKADEGIGKLIQEGLFGRTGVSLIPLLIILRLIMAFIWFILAVVLLAIFPRQISFATDQIRKAFWPVFGTGVLSIVVFSGLVDHHRNHHQDLRTGHPLLLLRRTPLQGFQPQAHSSLPGGNRGICSRDSDRNDPHPGRTFFPGFEHHRIFPWF